MATAFEKGDQQHTGIWIGFVIPPAEAVALAGERGDPDWERAEDLHMTLLFLGDSSQYTPKQIQAIRRSVAGFANMAPPLDGTVSGWGVFGASPGSEGKNVLVNLFDSADLLDWRDGLIAAVEAVGAQVSRAHGFTPHITRAYLPTYYGIPNMGPVEPMPLTFDTLYVRVADTPSAYRLLGQALEKRNPHWPTQPRDDRGRWGSGGGPGGGPAAGGGGEAAAGGAGGGDGGGGADTGAGALAAKVNGAPAFGSYGEAEAWRKEQKGDANFDTLQTAVSAWQGHDVETLRNNTKAVLRGEEGTPEARLLLGSIHHAAPEAPVLFRGSNTDADPAKLAAQYKKGGTFDLDVASFTADKNVANAYANGILGRKGDTQLVFQVEGGSKGLRLDGFAANSFGFVQKEWISGGRFEVTGVKQTGNKVEVSIKQTGTFGVN